MFISASLEAINAPLNVLTYKAENATIPTTSDNYNDNYNSKI
jgi:hypothetical protein